MLFVHTDSTSCKSGLCGANTVCFDEIIGYSCACRDGYTFEDNLKDCKQVNECERQPPHCDLSADCADTVGSFECTCHPGYKGDGRTCVLNGEWLKYVSIHIILTSCTLKRFCAVNYVDYFYFSFQQ